MGNPVILDYSHTSSPSMLPDDKESFPGVMESAPEGDGGSGPEHRGGQGTEPGRGGGLPRHPHHDCANLNKSGGFAPNAGREGAGRGKSHDNGRAGQDVEIAAQNQRHEPPGNQAGGGEGQVDAAHQALVGDGVEVGAGGRSVAPAAGGGAVGDIGKGGQEE